MAIRGQRFELDLDADDWTFNIADEDESKLNESTSDFIKEIKEHNPAGVPPPPKARSTRSGFPQHRPKKTVSTFKQRRQSDGTDHPPQVPTFAASPGPSDRAIAHHIGKKHGVDLQAKEKADIDEENKRRIAEMSIEEIEEARSELLANMSSNLVSKFLQRANIEEDTQGPGWEDDSTGEEAAFSPAKGSKKDVQEVSSITAEEETVSDLVNGVAPRNVQTADEPPSVHFPVPVRNPSNYVALDPNSPNFLADLRTHYFPDTPHDPNVLNWLQDPTEEDVKASPYAPTQTRYASSDIRFGFEGRLIPPSESANIPVDKGLHHHGEAPESAGYTIPELSMLARSTLPNQRCIAHQMMGRILFRLGRGDFGPRGSELQEGLWGCIEHERTVEVIMAEANREGGHVSAKAYATEALWLWKKGGGGDRGILKDGEKIAK